MLKYDPMESQPHRQCWCVDSQNRGQTELCHPSENLALKKTREGDLTNSLRKIEAERAALGGGVFDVLGKAIGGTELRKLLDKKLFRYGDQPDVKARLTRKWKMR